MGGYNVFLLEEEFVIQDIRFIINPAILFAGFII